jgi:hypothetical protein
MAESRPEHKEGLHQPAALLYGVGAAGFEPAVPARTHQIGSLLIFATDRLLTTRGFSTVYSARQNLPPEGVEIGLWMSEKYCQ